MSIFDRAADDRYFEDYPLGSIYRFGEIGVDLDDVIAFASRYDPQVFHTDPKAAQDTIFGGLIASGWHTAALMMRLFCDHYLSKVASLGSPGLDEVRWPRPVRPGDRLSLRVTVAAVTPSRSKPDRGVITSLIEVLNQRDEVVMSMKAANMLKRRCEGGGGA